MAKNEFEKIKPLPIEPLPPTPIPTELDSVETVDKPDIVSLNISDYWNIGFGWVKKTIGFVSDTYKALDNIKIIIIGLIILVVLIAIIGVL